MLQDVISNKVAVSLVSLAPFRVIRSLRPTAFISLISRSFAPFGRSNVEPTNGPTALVLGVVAGIIALVLV